MAAPAATEAAIRRALSAAKAAGLHVSGFSVSREGKVEVQCGEPARAEELDSSAKSGQVVKPRQWGKR